MGTDTGSGMRAFLHFFLASAALCCGQPLWAGSSDSVVMATSGGLVAETTLNCQQPIETDPAAIETSVHPIWRIDSGRLDLGYIADNYSATADIGIELPLLTGIGSDAVTARSDSSMGVRLENGWSLGFTYELLDARFKVGPFLLPEPGDPVFEGPKFVATLKFR